MFEKKCKATHKCPKCGDVHEVIITSSRISQWSYATAEISPCPKCGHHEKFDEYGLLPEDVCVSELGRH